MTRRWPGAGGGRGGEQVPHGCGAGAVDGREDDLVKEGKRICAISATGLSRRQLKIRVRGLRLVLRSRAESSAESPRAGGVVGDVENPFGGAPLSESSRMRSRRAGQLVLRMPLAMDVGVIGKPWLMASSTAAAMARAMLRCWWAPCSGECDSMAVAEDLDIGGSVSRLRAAALGGGHIGNGADAADVELGGHFAEDLVGFGMLRQGDQRAAWAQDAGFFAGNGGDGGAEPLGVVEGDVGDDGEERIDDVGGVEAAAHADFEDSDLDFGLGKVEKGHGGQDFEEAGELRSLPSATSCLRGIVDAEVDGGEGIVGDFGAIDADALVGAREMRRGVEAGAQAGGGQDRGEGRGRGAFAVGAGDEDGGKRRGDCRARRAGCRSRPVRTCGARGPAG